MDQTSGCWLCFPPTILNYGRADQKFSCSKKRAWNLRLDVFLAALDYTHFEWCSWVFFSKYLRLERFHGTHKKMEYLSFTHIGHGESKKKGVISPVYPHPKWTNSQVSAPTPHMSRILKSSHGKKIFRCLLVLLAWCKHPWTLGSVSTTSWLSMRQALYYPGSPRAITKWCNRAWVIISSHFLVRVKIAKRLVLLFSFLGEKKITREIEDRDWYLSRFIDRFGFLFTDCYNNLSITVLGFIDAHDIRFLCVLWFCDLVDIHLPPRYQWRWYYSASLVFSVQI
jgi:hypothetical protein